MPLPNIAQPRTAGLSAGAAWRQEPLKQNPINKHTKSTWHEPNLHATCTHIQATQEHEMAWDRIATLLSFGSSCLPQNLAELELALWPPHPATTAATPFFAWLSDELPAAAFAAEIYSSSDRVEIQLFANLFIRIRIQCQNFAKSGALALIVARFS